MTLNQMLPVACVRTIFNLLYGSDDSYIAEQIFDSNSI